MARSSGDRPADQSDEQVPRRAVFRMPLIAVILLPVLAAFCLGPIATAGAWFALFFLVPVLIGVAVLLTRTVVDDRAITVHGLRPARRLPWDELDRLEFSGPRWAVAVGHDGRRIRLPMVRPRDLPVVAAVSGGSLTFTAPPAPDTDTDTTPDGGSDSDAPTAAPAPPPSDGARPATPSGGPTS